MAEHDALADELRRATTEAPSVPDLDLRYADQRDAITFSVVMKVAERPDIVAHIDALAHRRGTTRAAIVREAVRAFLESQEAP